jgi:hypothetical protein
MTEKGNNGAWHLEVLEALNQQLIGLLGDGYAIKLDDPKEFESRGRAFTRFSTRCVYFTHNDKHYDENPSAWIAVTADGRLMSSCWVCKRKQVVHHGCWQPAPTLLTVARNDPKLLEVLVSLGCVELPERGNGAGNPAVGFPVTYANGETGYHYRVALEGKSKWLHQAGGKASEAVFALHSEGIQDRIQKERLVIVTESPFDACVLIATGIPAIAVLGKGNTWALAHDYHREALMQALGDDGVVYVWQEPDATDFAQQVASALQRPVRVITPDDTAKDAFRIWQASEKNWAVLKLTIIDLIVGATEVAPQPELKTEVVPQPEPEAVKHDTTTKVRVKIPEGVFKRIGEITMQGVEWLVNDYIPIGVVTLLAGEGGHGKSTLLCDLAAAVLKGDKWLNRFEVVQGGVVLIVTEGVTEIRSKLEGYGITDGDPLIIVDLTAWDGYTPLKATQALPEILRQAKERLGDTPVKLVGLDCLRGFGFDEKQATRQKGDRLPTVREIYNPLTDFAQREGSAVVVTHHFRKLLPEERRHLYPKRKKGKEVAPDIDINLLRNLIAGTADIVNAARHALVVVSDIEAGTGVIVPVKSNRSQVLGTPIRYDWEAETPTFLRFMAEDETVIEKATAFLRRVLSNGAMASEKVKELAEKEGISGRTLWRAKSRLGVKSAKRVDGDEVMWIWFLPDRPN